MAVELKRSGVNVNVISDPKEQEPGLFRILESEGIKVHKCMGLSDISRPILPLLYNLVTAERYEVVHLYGIQKSYKMWGMKHLHANFPRITVNLNSLLLTPAWVGTLKSIIAYKLMLDKSCDSIVTVSNFLAEILRTRYDIAQEKIRVIQNGMALDWFDRNMKTEPDAKLLSAIEALKDKPIVCKVGYLYPLKGYEYFLRAAEMVLDQEKDVQFLVVGDGPQLNYLKKYAHTHGLTNNVHFTAK